MTIHELLSNLNRLTEYWQFYKLYPNYHAAFCEIGTVKNMGYASTKIKAMQGGFAIYTMRFKEVQANG